MTNYTLCGAISHQPERLRTVVVLAVALLRLPFHARKTTAQHGQQQLQSPAPAIFRAWQLIRPATSMSLASVVMPSCLTASHRALAA